jgi:hypothetical protein
LPGKSRNDVAGACCGEIHFGHKRSLKSAYSEFPGRNIPLARRRTRGRGGARGVSFEGAAIDREW